MSLAPSKSPPSAEPAFDLDYSINDFEVDPHRDSAYLFRRTEDAMFAEALARGGRTLDVACGVGRLGARVTAAGGEGWGIEPSAEMLGLSHWLLDRGAVTLVRGIAEALPFADRTFDRVVCQGSLDHFVAPERFMAEAARVLRPGGRIVVALANYESLSCRLGRLARALGEAYFGVAPSGHRPYWSIPPDHFHNGNLAFVRRLGGRGLALERCYGLSLLWLLRGWGDWRWGAWLDGLTRPLAEGLLRSLDRVAYHTPALADMIVSVWRPRGETR